VTQPPPPPAPAVPPPPAPAVPPPPPSSPAAARRCDPACLLATAGGLGYFPFAPATFTSLVLTALLLWIGAAPGPSRFLILGGAILLLSAAGVWATGRAEKRYGHDARCLVLDEVAGMLIAAWLMPWDWPHLLAAFVLFRAFDVLKPPPVYQFQSFPGGWGVVMDDIGAGIYALGAGLLLRLLPGF